MIEGHCDKCKISWIGDGRCPHCWGTEAMAKPSMEHVLDQVAHPPHYTQGGIECIAAIRAALTADEFRGYIKGNVLKYVWREKNKGKDQDLAKAAWYLDELGGKHGRGD